MGALPPPAAPARYLDNKETQGQSNSKRRQCELNYASLLLKYLGVNWPKAKRGSAPCFSFRSQTAQR